MKIAFENFDGCMANIPFEYTEHTKYPVNVNATFGLLFIMTFKKLFYNFVIVDLNTIALIILDELSTIHTIYFRWTIVTIMRNLCCFVSKNFKYYMNLLTDVCVKNNSSIFLCVHCCFCMMLLQFN